MIIVNDEQYTIMKQQLLTARNPEEEQQEWRNTTQPLIPVHNQPGEQKDSYDIYPLHKIAAGLIQEGYTKLAIWIATKKIVLIDGAAGVFWEDIKISLSRALFLLGVRVTWHDTKQWLRNESAIDLMVAPFTGPEGDVWGKKTGIGLKDFFETSVLQSLSFPEKEGVHIIMGHGAAFAHENAPIIYCELSKTELQYRMRAGSVTNLGSKQADTPAEMYKRFYFVDWVVLNRHKEAVRDRIEIMTDVQWKDTLTWLFTDNLQYALQQLILSAFRVRPWFEAGAWGGQWMKEHIHGITKKEINYAWSFELIVPENGILLESDGLIFELPFEWLMYYQQKAILGRHAAIFKNEFPIRFDFLDTFDGGNLSIQCHPSLDYIRKYFGENITQDETYYILDCKKDAGVYLGFQENIDPSAFMEVLNESRETGIPVQIEEYVQLHPATKHDFFLIPNRVVHSAGANNMVLEISATPYIFTFKMYDWLRPGLDGKPRAINIEHAFNNLDFSRKGTAVQQLISKPYVLEEGAGWQLIHLPTHEDHFYDVHRIEFDDKVDLPTMNHLFVMMLVEGTSILVTAASGTEQIYHYAETFVVPAAVRSLRIQNLGKKRAKLIKAFIKPSHPIFQNLDKEI